MSFVDSKKYSVVLSNKTVENFKKHYASKVILSLKSNQYKDDETLHF